MINTQGTGSVPVHIVAREKRHLLYENDSNFVRFVIEYYWCNNVQNSKKKDLILTLIFIFQRNNYILHVSHYTYCV